MLHPSYTDLMKVVNSSVEQGEAPVVNSRYSIVMATSKRARQIIEQTASAPVRGNEIVKELAVASREIAIGKVKCVKD